MHITFISNLCRQSMKPRKESSEGSHLSHTKMLNNYFLTGAEEGPLSAISKSGKQKSSKTGKYIPVNRGLATTNKNVHGSWRQACHSAILERTSQLLGNLTPTPTHLAPLSIHTSLKPQVLFATLMLQS